MAPSGPGFAVSGEAPRYAPNGARRVGGAARRGPPFGGAPTVFAVSPTELDRRLLVAARTRGHSPGRDRAVERFSRAGEHAACWLALGGAGAAVDGRRDPERRARWLRSAGVVAGAYALNTAIKFVVRRTRPQLPGLPPLTATPTRLSFPSAHATTGFAAARLYGRLMPAAPLYGVAGLLAASRVYLGVHYPSDVAAGAVLGTLLAGIGAPPCR